MWHPLGNLFRNTKLTFEEADLRFLVQEWLRDQLKSEAVYCERVRGGVVEVRVGAAALHQEVLLREFELQELLKEQADYELKNLMVKGS